MQRPADSWGSDRGEPLPPGHRVGGWEVTGPLGAGGWATVHAGRRAADATPATGAPADPAGAAAADPPGEVALKVLPTGGLAPRQARAIAESARREVELGRRAGHPRLIRLLDSFVLSEPGHPHLDGAIVLVMERAERSLRERLATPVTAAEGARLITGITEGLAHLHRSGWVHGDLKPDNVLLMGDGSVKLADFGLATELTGTHGTHGYAPPMGTLDYLPPERRRAPLGEHGIQVRPSADVWALGILIHEVFAGGAPPFPGATPMARAAAAQEYAEGRAALRTDHALPPFWRGLATDCLAPTHESRAAHTADTLLHRITATGAAKAPTTESPITESPITESPITESPITEARAPESPTTEARAPESPTAESPTAGGRAAEAPTAGDPTPQAPPAPAPASPRPPVRAYARPLHHRARRRARAALLAGVAAVCGAAVALWPHGARDAAPAAARAETTGSLRVFNAEQGCRNRTDRNPRCSLGLAIDPLKAYTPDNVVATRVWDGEVLAVDCFLPRGMPIVDESDAVSVEWFRVRLPGGAARPTAWLPAVRTKDRPAVPECPRPTPAN
ncbi:protein kinase [Streptomyces lavendulae]|uniref:serine/threonine-protein kinase n=1 Tax=Streptomyces lavendulae TaxID=1914 RepID=UPI003673F59C